MNITDYKKLINILKCSKEPNKRNTWNLDIDLMIVKLNEEIKRKKEDIR
jgi:hypothetical protein